MAANSSKLGPVEFRPMQGLLSLGQQLAEAFGLSHVWEGEEGLGEVARRKLEDLGVPSHPVPLSGPGSVSPLQMAEHAGFIKRRKRLKAK